MDDQKWGLEAWGMTKYEIRNPNDEGGDRVVSWELWGGTGFS